MDFCLSLIIDFVNDFLTLLIAAVGFLVIASSVTMSAPFFLGKVIDTIYSSTTEDFTASLTSLCFMLTGVFLCGGAANAARVYLMQISGEASTRIQMTKMLLRIYREFCGLRTTGQKFRVNTFFFFFYQQRCIKDI